MEGVIVMGNEKLSRIVGLRLLAIKEGVECGAIREVVMDVDKKSVEYLVLDTGKGCFGFCVLPNSKIAGMGKDFAITSSSEHVISIWKEEEAMQLAYTDSDLIGARVVSSAGDVIGKIVDFEFQLVEGLIEKYIMEDGGVLPKESIVTLSRGIVFIDSDRLEQGEFVSEPAYEAVEEAPAEKVVAQETAVMEEAPVQEEAPAAQEPAVQEQPAEAEVAPTAETVEAPEEPAAEEAPAEPPLASRLAALRNRAPAAGQNVNADTKNYFEKRRAEYVIGKTVKQRITAADGTVLAEAGQTVTAEMIEKITAEDKLTELTMGVN